MTPEEQLKADMKKLLSMPEFLRSLVFPVIQMSRILSPTTDGSVDRHLAFDEGRRSLGLEILSMVEQGQPVAHPSGQPILTMMQALREEATKPQEKARHDRYDRNRDLDDDD